MNYIPVFTTDLLNKTTFSKAHLKAFQKIHATAEDISKIIVEHLRQSFGKLNQYRLIIRLAKCIFASSVKIEFHHRHCELKQFAACSFRKQCSSYNSYHCFIQVEETLLVHYQSGSSVHQSLTHLSRSSQHFCNRNSVVVAYCLRTSRGSLLRPKLFTVVLVIYCGIRHFQEFLKGANFHIEMDYKPLVG